MSARIRRRIVAHGRVQGVFFRDSVRQRAEAEGVAGWVRNCPEGTVEAVLEGDHAAVGRLLRFCSEGPRGARVERAETFEEEPEGLSGFSVQ